MASGVNPRPDFVSDYKNAFRAGRSLGARAQSERPVAPGEAQRRAELYRALGASLLGRPYEERRAILAHLAPALAKQGLPPEAVAEFDPTDAAIARSMESARTVGSALQAGEGA